MKKLFIILGILVIMAFPLVVNAETPYVLRDGFSYPVISSDMPYRVVINEGSFYSYIVSTQPLLVEQMLVNGVQHFILHSNNALSRFYLIQRGSTSLIYASTQLESRRLGHWMVTVNLSNYIKYSSHDLVLFRDEFVTIPLESRTVFFSAPPPPPFLPSMAAEPLPHQLAPTLQVLLGVGILVLGLVVLLPRLVIWVIRFFSR